MSDYNSWIGKEWWEQDNPTYNAYADGDSWGTAFQDDQSWMDKYVTPSFQSNPFQQVGGSDISGGWDHTMNPQPNYRFAQQPMGSGIGGGMQPNQMSLAQQWLNPQTLLGLGGGIAGLIGAISGGGVQKTQQPQMNKVSRTQLQNANSANTRMLPFLKGQTPLQQQQAQLLQAITGGQGLDQNYARAIEQTFEPQMGNLYEQATAAGRKRGFHDSPATSPAGGAILGPGLADLQGQIAAEKIKMMMGLPGLFQNPINTQAQMANAFAGNQGNLFSPAMMGQQQSAPLGPTVGMTIGKGLEGIGMGMAQNQQMQQQNTFNNALLQMMQRQSTPYEFGGYSGT